MRELPGVNEQGFDFGEIVLFSQQVGCASNDPASSAATSPAHFSGVDSVLLRIGYNVVGGVHEVLLTPWRLGLGS